MADNSLLTAVALIERVISQLMLDSRAQLDKARLQIIQQYNGQILQALNSAEVSDVFIVGNIIDAEHILAQLINDPSYTETDTETKDIIGGKFTETLSNIYLYAGKYYETHEFEYSSRLQPILTRIIDACIKNGYYFGFK